MLFASSSESLINETHKLLSLQFEIKDLGLVNHFLGINIKRNQKNLFEINQEEYILKIATAFEVQNAKPQKYPIDPGYYSLTDDELLSSNTEYRKLIGMLLYVSTHTRPDVSAAVCILAQRVEKPRQLDFNEALRIVKYLNGTRHLSLRLNDLEKAQKLFAYSDANFGECRLNGKSNSGILCYVNGGPIIWQCCKQTNVALSTCEAEYYAVTEAAKEILWLKKLLEDFEISNTDQTLIFNDNQSCLNMLVSGDFAQRTKYIAVKYHFLRDHIKSQSIKVEYCASEYNLADMLTKPLNSVRITFLRRLCGLSG